MREESRGSTGWRDCRPGSMVRWGLHWVNSFDGSGRPVRFERLRRSGASNALKLSGPDATVHFDDQKVDNTSFNNS